MDKKVLNQLNSENAEAIFRKIREDAEAEAANLLERAQKEAQRMIKDAGLEAQRQKESQLKVLEKEAAQIKERAVSSLNLEKKRRILNERSRFVEAVLEAVKAKAEAFRRSAEYAHFLEKAVLEGIEVIAEDEIEVFYSYLDEAIFSEAFIKKIEKNLDKRHKLKFTKSDFRDPGVIVDSSDGRMLYDNRFLGRLKRVYDEVYMELLKEAAC